MFSFYFYNMYMRLVIVEDEQINLEELVALVLEWNQSIKILTYESAEEMLFKQEEWVGCDGILLDIELRKMNGMQLAKKIRLKDRHIPILFVTGYEKYVFEGYDVGAVGYIMKPIHKDNLFKCLDRMKSIMETQCDFIVIEDHEQNRKLYVHDICFVESDGHYCNIYTFNDKHLIKKSMKEMSELLKSYSFAFCHRSYLVNLENIRCITKKDCICENNMHIPISRTKWQSLHNLYMDTFRRS